MGIMMKKDVVAGLGEIGLPILKILSKKEKIVGYDINKKLMNEMISPGSALQHYSCKIDQIK